MAWFFIVLAHDMKLLIQKSWGKGHTESIFYLRYSCFLTRWSYKSTNQLFNLLIEAEVLIGCFAPMNSNIAMDKSSEVRTLHISFRSTQTVKQPAEVYSRITVLVLEVGKYMWEQEELVQIWLMLLSLKWKAKE